MHKRIIFPLDVPSEAKAFEWCFNLHGHVGVMKVGLELFTRFGPQALVPPRDYGHDIMLDLKLHDIPNTVAKAVASACSHGPLKFLTVHAAGGSEMVKAAVDAARGAVGEDKQMGRPMILAVTVLTSLAGADFARIFNQTENNVEHVVKKLAVTAYEAGARGFVCSPLEVKVLRELLGPDVTLVVPGIRPPGSDTDDQKRVATPEDAIANGADYLVIGRPIRNAKSPEAACGEIAKDIAAGMAKREAG